MKKISMLMKSDKDTLISVFDALCNSDFNDNAVYKVLKKHPKKDGNMLSKGELTVAFKRLNDLGELNYSDLQKRVLLKNIQMKKVRTISGVTPVTVLTKPYPCPGKCIFCPNDVRMPKSYLSDEPGAQRAEANRFDPYLQTYNRLVAFRNTGHPTDKVELLVLGGTWSVYPLDYQIWFVKRCFDALNEFDAKYDTKMISPEINLPFDEDIAKIIDGNNITKNYNRVVSEALVPKVFEAKNEKASWDELLDSHKINETAKTRCIGMVLETRPDEINVDEIVKLRRLGTTRVQIGIQSLNDEVLKLNKRGHNVAKTREAFDLLRQAGFKILAHWMPNLYGSSPEKDVDDYKKLFTDLSIRPDELKIYPCSLIESAELMKYYKNGLWEPYTPEELLKVVKFTLTNTPRYCRLNRVIRDIPSTDIVVGNKKTNFRQIAEDSLKGEIQTDIRSRELRGSDFILETFNLKETKYQTNVSTEIFLEYVDDKDRLAGFLRLSLPTCPNFISELKDCAIIREVHVYGTSVRLGVEKKHLPQHQGLGKELIQKAKDLAKESGFPKLAVISSIGTREYYAKQDFKQNDLYQICSL